VQPSQVTELPLELHELPLQLTSPPPLQLAVITQAYVQNDTATTAIRQKMIFILL